MAQTDSAFHVSWIGTGPGPVARRAALNHVSNVSIVGRNRPSIDSTLQPGPFMSFSPFIFISLFYAVIGVRVILRLIRS
ncbi:MAG TPA: hypothetical protein VGR08_11195, partial [Thermomicrobiales bacterium]|nr:hypothetical protein [Thermomicrobiales bacterium]